MRAIAMSPAWRAPTNGLVADDYPSHNPPMRNSVVACLLFFFVFPASQAIAGPYIQPGDIVLRHDIQNLADHGLINGPVTSWPLAWGPINEQLASIDVVSLPRALADSIVRLRSRAITATKTDRILTRVKVGGAEKPTPIRSFQNTPRGEGEFSVGASWIGERFSIDLNLLGVGSDQDKREFRYDGSLIGIVLSNWSIAASTQERWWGPGWDGSLILSNNARPIPSVVIDRIFTDAFETKWLSWLGPWDLSVMMGELERERAVPNARFFGLRFNFRPLDTLEIGLSRTAQWCGDSRPCEFDTFADLLVGKDNRGDAGIGPENEPGNQLAGVDLRWSPNAFAHKFAFYGQFVGEDEAGGFPSRWLGQVGGEWSGHIAHRWSARLFAEIAATKCKFYESSDLFNCAYNHDIYQTGYRYRNRSIGHGADNDAELISIGTVLVDTGGVSWHSVIRLGKLNRGGPPDPNHTLTSTPQDIASIDIGHSRTVEFGVVDFGLGYEQIDAATTGVSFDDVRFYIQWRSTY